MMIKGGTIEQVGALLDTFAQNDFNCMTTGILKPTLCFHVARQSPASATTKSDFFQEQANSASTQVCRAFGCCYI